MPVELWQGNFTVVFRRSVDMSIPPSLENRHVEEAQSGGSFLLAAADEDAPPGMRTWSGDGRASARYNLTTIAKNPAYTISGLTSGDGVLEGSASLMIDPSSGEYFTRFFVDELLPVTETNWRIMDPDIERLAEKAKEGDSLEALAALPALLVLEAVPPFSRTERMVTVPYGTSDRQPLPDSGFVLAGSLKRDGVEFFWTLRPAGMEEPLLADAGGPYEIVRGEPLQLDGSRSTGDISEYEWTFALGADCPPDAPFNAEAQKSGVRPNLVLLCDVQATLTVRDGEGNESRSDPVPIVVLPRNWETPSGHDGEEGRLTPSMVPDSMYDIFARRIDGVWDARHVGALNVGAEDDRLEAGKLFHPVRDENDSWADRGYDLVRVEDPDGPFDGFYKADAYRVRLFRRTLLNPHLHEQGIRLRAYWGDGRNRNFYEYNSDSGRKDVVDAYIQSIRDHEREHTRLMMLAVEGEDDPAREVERMFHTDRNALREMIDRTLREAERRACRESLKLHDNPLPGDMASYPLWFPREDLGAPVEIVVPPYSITPEKRAEENAACDR